MNRSLFVSFALATALSTFAACGSPPAQSAPPQHAQASDPTATCTQTFVRERACTDTFIPALVDARARHDMPAGIADQVKADRAGVIAEAMTEWKNDSTDDAIAQTCARLGPTFDDRQAAAANASLAKSDCAQFTASIMPLVESHL
jgi:hypothetical protein